MKTLLLSSLALSILAGCSSGVSQADLDQFREYTGGRVMGDTTSLYWYTEKLISPYTAADYVYAGDYGWFKTDYRWAGGELRELVRQGEQIQENQERVPYTIHVRFNKDGEAIYQQYKINGKVLPLKNDKLSWLKQEAANIPKVTKAQSKEGAYLIQGYWDGSEFETCANDSYEVLEFNQTLPSFVVNRLSSVDSYVALLGSNQSDKVVVQALLMLADDDHDCIERPSMVES
ncbi:DUF1481 domain-containing protein [Vibrio japonicus]|uniref:DUF1481 domain-containing protein n=1 Tax=Vibrio japonicus TaxID=1824638 RepID=A0ABY5LIK6_9VIBR|nr:DUF1481 domain-containing protein [Vibrio japonicus]UUM31877.1 DUF1481 domain-containing protein [Vibrio japonicus]